MGRRSDHSKEQIREMALTAARDIISKEGLGGMSARKIANAIGYTVGTLYLVFENLDDLVIHVNGQTLDEMYQSIQVNTKRSRRPETRINALGRAYIQFATDQRHLWGAIFEHQLPAGQHYPDWYFDKVLQNFSLVEEALTPYCEGTGKKRIQLLARALWSGVHGVCVLAFSRKIDVAGVDTIVVLTDLLIKTFLNGLKQSN